MKFPRPEHRSVIPRQTSRGILDQTGNLMNAMSLAYAPLNVSWGSYLPPTFIGDALYRAESTDALCHKVSVAMMLMTSTFIEYHALISAPGITRAQRPHNSSQDSSLYLPIAGLSG